MPGKRKSTPRKLDSEKCQLCRQHKLKCTPQPRVWPQKCDRCLCRGLECSPGEVKRRARRLATGEEEPEDVAFNISSAPMVSGNSQEAPRRTWGIEDVMSILTVVQLLNSEYEIHHSQKTSLTHIFKLSGQDSQVQVPYVSSLHQSLPLLKDKLSLAFKARLGRGSLCLAERTVLETALVNLHGDLPQRPMTASDHAQKPSSWAQVCDLLFQARSLTTKSFSLRRLACLASDIYSEDLMRKFGLYNWSHVEQGFGSEWEHLLPHSVLGPLLFDSGEHYREPKSYVKIWIHDVVTREGSDIGFASQNFASIPAQSWTLSDLAFLVAEVGLGEKDNQGLSLIHAAILDRRPDIVRQLIMRGAKVSHRIRGKRFSLFHFAAAVGCQDSYLELRFHPDLAPAEETRDRNGMLPLHVAALHGHTRVVEAILSANCHDADYVNRETSESGQTALSLALTYPDVGDTAEFLARYPGVNLLVDRDMDQTALHVAVSHRKYSLFQSLLSFVPGEMINKKNENGETPLHILARYGDRETIEAALRVPEVDPDLVAGDESTPLVNAVMEARVDAVKILAVRGDVDIAALRRPLEPLGVSALDYAKQEAERDVAHMEYCEVLKFLRDNFEELAEDFNDSALSEDSDGDVRATRTGSYGITA
ncbi:ankyrin repeat protein [Colletotrichum incanum]|nr:ankyrin repeat protein [Colletotrichum incanum]